MSQSGKNQDMDKEQIRLEFCFDRGVDLERRIIQLTGEIEDGITFNILDAALTELESRSRKNIIIKINSPGGSVYEALAIIDRMRESKCQIITKCYGHAMSAAGMVLVAGHKRFIGPNSWFMYHEISSHNYGTVTEMEENLAQLKREMNEWARCMATFTNKSKEFWHSIAAKKDLYLSPDECMLHGIVDGTF